MLSAVNLMDNTVDGLDQSKSLLIFEENGQDDSVNVEENQINIDACDETDQPLNDETQYPC